MAEQEKPKSPPPNAAPKDPPVDYEKKQAGEPKKGTIR